MFQREEKLRSLIRIHPHFCFRGRPSSVTLMVWMVLMVFTENVIMASQFEAAPETEQEVFIQNSVPRPGIWEGKIGDGFRPDVWSLGLTVGGTRGLAQCGSHEAHHLALLGISYGAMLGPVRGAGHWYQGNWELRTELWGGAQVAPDSDWLVGLTPHLRYDFATGTRVIPFLNLGIGATVTGIGPPDLGGKFQFNEQVGGGAYWFVTSNVAVSTELLYFHWSNAGIKSPNCGLNGISGKIGVSFFF